MPAALAAQSILLRLSALSAFGDELGQTEPSWTERREAEIQTGLANTIVLAHSFGAQTRIARPVSEGRLLAQRS